MKNQDGSYSYGNFSNGIGIGDSDEGGFHSIVGCDIHTYPGKITGSFALTNTDSGGIVDNLPTCCATLTNGDTFFASSSGAKIWKCTPAGVVSLVATNGQGNVLGMGFYGGYLYYACASKLGRIAEANASSEASWSSQNDSWATFSNSDSSYKPMMKVGSMFLIGDGRYVAGIIAGVFSPNLFDAFTGDRVTAIIPYGSYALIGTIISSSVGKSRIHLWDRYSQYPTTSDEDIDESGVNMFFKSGQVVYAQIGTVGNLYYWNGSNAIFYKKLRDGDNTVTTGVNPYGAGNLNGLPLINTIRGVFSLGRSDANLPIAQVVEYVPSLGQGSTAGALAVVGSQVFVASKNGTSKVIDKISTNKYSGKFVTPVSYGKLSTLKAYYSSMPTGTSITAKIKNDDGSFTSHTLIKDNTSEMCYKSQTKIGNISMVQVEITLAGSTIYSPTVYDLHILKN